MKIYMSILFVISFSTLIYAQDTKQAGEMIFKEERHDFATIWYKTEAFYDFVFKNTGKVPIVITRVQSSCGCTVPEYEKKPVPPKGKGIIRVKYDSSKIGEFYKTIKIYSNAKNSPVTLIIQGNVKVTD